MSNVVTGDAVVLDLRLAKLASRAVALFLDVLVQFVLLVIGVLLVTGLSFTGDAALVAAAQIIVVVIVVVGYPVTFETLTGGRSLGKIAMGLRVVRDDGGPIRFRHALVRGIVGLVDFWLPLLWFTVALVCSLASSRGKRLGDLLAGTVVVHERVPVHTAAMTQMPPALGWWAAGLDLSRVPDDLALAARQYLARFSDLSPEAQASMGARLAGAVAAVTSPPPPPGVPAWAFLAAVVAERRRREILRLQGAPPGIGPSPSWGGTGRPPPAPTTPHSRGTKPAVNPEVAPPERFPFAPPG